MRELMCVHSSIKHKTTVAICGDTVANKHSVELKEAH